MSNNKLRIGLLLSGLQTPAWIHTSISEISRSDIGELCLVVLANPTPPASGTTYALETHDYKDNWIRRGVRRVLNGLYRQLIDRRMYLRDAHELIDSQDLLADVPVVSATAEKSERGVQYSTADVKTVQSHNLDVLIHFDGPPPGGELLEAARYGIWSICHSDNLVNHCVVPGYWESMQNRPVTGSALRILSEDSGSGKILCRSYSCTQRLSVRDNRNNYYWKSVSFLTRKLRELHRLGGDAFMQNIEKANEVPTFYTSKLNFTPTNAELARHVFRKILEKTRTLIRDHFYDDQWILMFDFRESLSTSLHRYKKLLPPPDKFWADPFVVERNNRNFVFFEEYPYEVEKGHISVLEIFPDGTHTEPAIALEKPYHLSYPFIFDFEGAQYMVPESSENRTIELYKCDDFPASWTFQHNLISEINAVDATIFEHADRWWMFANVVETEGISSSDELFLFSSDSPVSRNWIPHPMNPIVSDCKSARPAGEIMRIGDRLFRPSQNSSNRYGYGFNFMEIEKITEQEYSEKLVTKILPEWDKTILGTHTFNRSRSLNVVDAIQVRRRR